MDEVGRSVVGADVVLSRPTADPLHRAAELQATAETDAAGARSLLDISTQLGIFTDGVEEKFGWQLSHWPECSEASLVWLPGRSKSFERTRPRLLGPDGEPESDDQRDQPEPWYRHPENDRYEGESRRMLDHLAEVEVRQGHLIALNWRIANGRAAAKSRRYFVRNRLRYMWVLTFANPHLDRRSVMSLVSEFARRLRAELGGAKFAYWYSPELHPGGHGWHVNFFIPVRVPHDLFASLWGHGFVWVTDFASSPKGPKGEPLGICRTPREGWRRAAQYGCKYSQKDWSPEHVGRSNHRYEVAQGFKPMIEKTFVNGPTHAEEMVAQLVTDSNQMLRWDSGDAENWERPPVRLWRW